MSLSPEIKIAEQRLGLPLVELVRMDAIFCRDLRHRTLLFEDFQHDLGFLFGCVALLHMHSVPP